MRTAWTILVMITLAGALHAQETPDVWIHNPEAGLTRARYSGAPAVLVFSAHWCGYCEKLESFFVDPKVRPISDKAVLILVEVESNAELMQKYNVEGHHQAVVLSWDRTVLARLSVDESPDKLLESFRQAVCTNEMEAAKVLVKVGRLAKAAERADGVLGLLKEGPLADQAHKLLEEIRKNAQAELVRARELLKAGKLIECALACDNILESFPPKMVSTEVKKLRKDMEQVKRGKPLEEEAPPERPEVIVARKAEDLVDRGMVAEWDGEYYQAVLLYEQAVKDFADQKATEDARVRLKVLRGNPETAGVIKKQEVYLQCQQLIQMARAYAVARHIERAREYYQRIIKEHPESEWAKIAQDELRGLKD